MQIIIDNNPIEVVIERKRIKNMYMRLKSDLKLHITCNKFVSDIQIKSTISSNHDFIRKAYYRELEKENPNIYRCLGDEYKIVIDETVKKVYKDNIYIYAKSIDEINKFYLKECKRFLTYRFNECYRLFVNVPEHRLRFRKMTTRWGVNNVRDKIITLNTELYKYDSSLIDYVIIHEFCHFKEANHSQAFWKEVEKYFPNYKLARKLLKG